MSSTQDDIAGRIQYTNVTPDLTREGIIDHLEACVEYRFQAAMISPCWIPPAKEYLAGSGVRITTTVNFPQATDTPRMKSAVIPELANIGADEFDFPPNPALLLSEMYREYQEEIALVVKIAHDHGLVVKAMLEFGYLPTEALKRRAASIAAEAGIDWVKNSSGWGKGGSPATVEDMKLLIAAVNGACGVKASGKVNTREKFDALRGIGVELFGTSSGIAILEGKRGDEAVY